MPVELKLTVADQIFLREVNAAFGSGANAMICDQAAEIATLKQANDDLITAYGHLERLHAKSLREARGAQTALLGAAVVAAVFLAAALGLAYLRVRG